VAGAVLDADLMEPPQTIRVVAFIQAGYFAFTGIWPLVHMRSFLAVTGPKTDLWLVKTVGRLVAVIGGAIAIDAVRGSIDPATFALAAGSAAALAAIDCIYVFRRLIGRIYLLDAAAEAALIVTWLLCWRW
jgi:hypothetical protein